MDFGIYTFPPLQILHLIKAQCTKPIQLPGKINLRPNQTGIPSSQNFHPSNKKGQLPFLARYRINIVQKTSTKINGNSKRPSRPRVKNLQSTKIQIKLDDSDSDHLPKQDKLNKKTHQAAALSFPFNATSKAYGDITGRFPYLSSSGNQYIFYNI